MDLFAGIPVADFTAALDWYEKLFGTPPSFFPHDTEAVWELAEHLFVYVVQQPDRAGHAINTLMVDDLDTRMTGIAARGLQPSNQETYGNGVRKITYTDPDGNNISFGSVSA